MPSLLRVTAHGSVRDRDDLVFLGLGNLVQSLSGCVPCSRSLLFFMCLLFGGVVIVVFPFIVLLRVRFNCFLSVFVQPTCFDRAAIYFCVWALALFVLSAARL